MLKYLTNVVENARIKNLETEVENLRGELDYLKKQVAAGVLGYTQVSWDNLSGKEKQPASAEHWPPWPIVVVKPWGGGTGTGFQGKTRSVAVRGARVLSLFALAARSC